MDKQQMAIDNAQALHDIGQHTIYMMGASFILGSLTTVLMLLVLDFIRRNKTAS